MPISTLIRTCNKSRITADKQTIPPHGTQQQYNERYILRQFKNFVTSLFFQIDNSHYLKTKNITCYRCNNSIIEGLNDRGDIISSIHYPSKSLEVNLTYLRIEWMRAVFLSCRLIFCSFFRLFSLLHISYWLIAIRAKAQ